MTFTSHAKEFTELRSRPAVVKDAEHYLMIFADENPKSCAGCEYWLYANSRAGQCVKSAPVPSADRFELLGFSAITRHTGAGHVFTPREHYCGDFSTNDKGE